MHSACTRTTAYILRLPRSLRDAAALRTTKMQDYDPTQQTRNSEARLGQIVTKRRLNHVFEAARLSEKAAAGDS